LVLVEDEDGEQPADVRPKEHTPGRTTRWSARREHRRGLGPDRSPRVDPLMALGVPLLTQEQDVVTGGGKRLGEPGCVDVRARALQEPSVPDQDSHGRSVGWSPRRGELLGGWAGSGAGLTLQDPEDRL